MSGTATGAVTISIDEETMYKLYRSYVVHEDELINNRVGWFIQLHSFLIATYGIVITSIIGSFSTEGKPLHIISAYPQFIGCLILLIIQIVGALSSHAARRSIDAATAAITELRDNWQIYCIDHPAAYIFPGLTGGGSAKITDEGLRLHRVLPHVLFSLWKALTVVPVLIAVLSAADSNILPMKTLVTVAIVGLVCAAGVDEVLRRIKRRRERALEVAAVH